jgi:hypothetical protein
MDFSIDYLLILFFKTNNVDTPEQVQQTLYPSKGIRNRHIILLGKIGFFPHDGFIEPTKTRQR